MIACFECEKLISISTCLNLCKMGMVNTRYVVPDDNGLDSHKRLIEAFVIPYENVVSGCPPW